MQVSTYKTDNEPYTDYELYCDNAPDGYDWKAVMFYDHEQVKWSAPEYSRSPSSDKVQPFEETDAAPPMELVNKIMNLTRVVA